jgi:hypothetical protein
VAAGVFVLVGGMAVGEGDGATLATDGAALAATDGAALAAGDTDRAAVGLAVLAGVDVGVDVGVPPQPARNTIAITTSHRLIPPPPSTAELPARLHRAAQAYAFPRALGHHQ